MSIRKITIALLAALAIATGSTAFISTAQAGGFDAWGVYHCFWHPVVVGYDFYGRPIFNRVCD